MYTKNRGFTLIELLIALILVGILAVIAMPNLTKWIRTNQVNADTEKIATLLNFARSEAVNLRRNVYVCPALIKTDGKPDRYCDRSHYSNPNVSAMVATLSVSRPQNSDLLHTIDLNNQISVNIYEASGNLLDNAASTPNNSINHIWAYFPDGYFKTTGRGTAGRGSFLNAQSVYIKIKVTNQEASVSSTLLVLPNGRVHRCTKTNVNDVDIKANIKTNLCA